MSEEATTGEEQKSSSVGVPLQGVEALRGLPLFTGLEEDELLALASGAVVRSFEAGTALVKAGAKWDALIILLQGKVRIEQVRLGLGQHVVADLGPGCPLALATVMDQLPCPSTIVGTESGEFLLVPGPALRDLLTRHPIIALRLLKALARRFRSFVQSLGALTLLTLEERLALFLVREGLPPAGEEGEPRTVALSHEEIGKRLGGSREEVTRILSRWKRRDLVTVGYRKVTVADPEGVRALVPELPDLQVF
jgi:CRP-like cAMP-binding protein